MKAQYRINYLAILKTDAKSRITSSSFSPGVLVNIRRKTMGTFNKCASIYRDRRLIDLA